MSDEKKDVLGDAIFPLHEDSYVEQVWFLSGRKMDMMILLWKEHKEGPFRCRVRTRSHHSADPWDPKDRKTIFDMRMMSEPEEYDPTDVEPEELPYPGDEAFCTWAKGKIKSIKQMWENAGAATRTKTTYWTRQIKGSSQQLIEVLSKQDFAAFKSIPVEKEPKVH